MLNHLMNIFPTSYVVDGLCRSFLLIYFLKPFSSVSCFLGPQGIDLVIYLAHVGISCYNLDFQISFLLHPIHAGMFCFQFCLREYFYSLFNFFIGCLGDHCLIFMYSRIFQFLFDTDFQLYAIVVRENTWHFFALKGIPVWIDLSITESELLKSLTVIILLFIYPFVCDVFIFLFRSSNIE